MSLLSCLRCATKFAVGLLGCPHCSSEEFEEADVPKITSGGVSYPQEPEAGGVEVEASAAVEAAEPEAVPVAAPEPAPAAKAAPSLPKAADG